MATNDATRPNKSEIPKKEFFSLNAGYLIAPNATFAQVMDDMGCLMSASLDAFEAMSSTFGKDSPGYAALYALRQANALHSAAAHMADMEWKPKATD